jgi:glucose/arabinose dehydrogenase
VHRSRLLLLLAALGIAACSHDARRQGALLVADDDGNVIWRVTAAAGARSASR